MLAETEHSKQAAHRLEKPISSPVSYVHPSPQPAVPKSYPLLQRDIPSRTSHQEKSKKPLKQQFSIVLDMDESPSCGKK